MTVDTLPTARRRGRPARIARAQIVQEALALLQSEGFEAFSMPRLGKRMGVSPMALYKHFAGRDAILEAVVTEIVSNFDYVPRLEKWDDDLLLWFKGVFDLFERFPVALSLLQLENESLAWLRVFAPLPLILSRMGLSKGRLSFVTTWASAVATGLVTVHSSPRWQARETFFSKNTGIDTVDAVLDEVDLYFGQYQKRNILDFGALCAVESIRRHFSEEATDPPGHG